jgi:hypothetical protein
MISPVSRRNLAPSENPTAADVRQIFLYLSLIQKAAPCKKFLRNPCTRTPPEGKLAYTHIRQTDEYAYNRWNSVSEQPAMLSTVWRPFTTLERSPAFTPSAELRMLSRQFGTLTA